MFAQGPSGAPRHMAGSKRTDRHPAPPVAAPAADPVAAELAEIAPVARVHRSRLAVAVSITVAALPILVLDNLPATAEAPERVEATAVAEDLEALEVLDAPSTTITVTTSESTTSTSSAPTTSTTAAPTTTVAEVAPPTTEAPSTTPVAALRAPTPAPPAPTTTVAPPPPPPAVEPARPGDPGDPATWEALARCESGGNWSANSGNGYYGGLQFSLQTWRGVGGAGYPHQASVAEQIRRGQILQARYGWGQWPHCSRALGLR